MGSKLQQRSEEQLLAALYKGDRLALDEIYHIHAPFLFRFAIKRLGCNNTAADLIQELFLKLWIKKGAISVKGELQAYLTLCLRNLIIDHYSRQQVRNKYLAAADLNDIDHRTMELLDYNDTLRSLQNGVEALPQKMQQVFQLSRIEGYSVDEIADEMNISRQTVKNQLSAASKRLRVSLSAILILTIITVIFFQK